jgi:hypothetical protein
MIRLTNYTDIPDEKTREIIRFVRPNGISGFDIRISNSKHIFAGTAYHEGSPRYHGSSKPFIVVRVTKDENAFPYFVRHGSERRTKYKLNSQSGRLEAVSYNTGTGGYLDYLLLSREETIVHVLAHELRHLWQAKIKRGYRVWGARGQFSERDADAYAKRKTREWRRKVQTSRVDSLYDQQKYLFLSGGSHC